MDITAGKVQEPKVPRRAVLAIVVVGVLVGVAAAALLHKSHPEVAGRTGSGTASDGSLQAQDLTFRDLSGATVPSGSAGPHSTLSGRALGFDHTVAGAVLAAINISYAADSSAGPAVFGPTIGEQVVGPDAPAFLAAVQADYASSSPGSPAAVAAREAQHVGPWAYRVDAYSLQTASVNVVIRQDTAGVPGYFNVSWVVQWVGGDWRLVAPLNGQISNIIRQVPGVPAGYTVIGRA